VPLLQVFVVQESLSLQSAAVWQGTQPGIVVIWQLPSPPQMSLVHTWSSLQSALVSQGMQPSMAR